MNKMSFPKIEGYVVTEKLGSGSYSTVYKAYTQVGARSIVAIKCVDKSRIKNSGSAVDNLITEIRLLKTLTHPHIVHMKHFTWDDRNIYIIMEFCCGGDLSKYIHRYGRVPEKQVLYFLQQLASALKFLRETGVVHMDLKPHNLLLHKGSDGKYILKVADFGFAQYMSSSWRRCVRGSPLYMAPEMLRGEYDARVDLWSVGVIMYECLFGRAPYSSNTFKELVDKIQAQAPIQIPRGSSISPECLDLLTRLLQHDPGRRITYEEFFAHEYLDLEHMPNKENYEKAVTLIKQAIELDSAGNLQEAFVHYRDSLRYLVPAVSAETDPVRKSALTAKLTRYMERAEEIKQFVRGGEGVAPPAPPPPPPPPPAPAPQRRPARAPACCAARPHTNSIDEFDQVRHNICAKCNCIAGQSDSTISGCSCGTPSQIGGPQDAGGGPDEVKEEQPAKQSVGVADVGKSNMRSALRRLFTRHPSMPYLTNNDSSITDNAEKPGKEKVPASEAANEVCRIT